MPVQDCFGSRDGGKLIEHLAPEDFESDGEPPALVVVEEDSVSRKRDVLLSELLSEGTVFRQQVIDSFLLSIIDPASENQVQELPWLKGRLHFSPNAACIDAASWISRIVLSIRKRPARAWARVVVSVICSSAEYFHSTGTSRRELLDHVLILNEGHLKRLLKEFIEEYYHRAWPHQGLDGDPPIPAAKLEPVTGASRLVSIPIVGGLHHRYERVAA